MKNDYNYIFDMDGTLYNFTEGDATFSTSKFYKDLKERIIAFIADLTATDLATATEEFESLNVEYNGEISLGFEKRYGVDRYAYFQATWNVDPAAYISKDKNLFEALASLNKPPILLTAAPRVWADRVLEYLDIKDIFTNKIYTGEPDIRKPDKTVFKKIAEELGCTPNRLISIGDQNYSDILPAKSVGMKTIIVGQEQLDADYRVDNVFDAIVLINKGLL